MHLARKRFARWQYARTIALAVLTTACLPASVSLAQAAGIPAGARYVAMGSSYAAGPGITVPADTPANRCQRSADNYARQLARKRKLVLVDVSCGGATTAHVLGRWGELPAQLDAVTPDTALVTVTIGGNDVGFAGGLIVDSCEHASGPVGIPAMCKYIMAMKAKNPQADPSILASPTEQAWQHLAVAMDRIAAEVHRRAHDARLVFVDYIRVLPDGALCELAPLSDEGAARARAVASRLAELTAVAARRGNALLVPASDLSRGHEVCAAAPWVSGFIGPVQSANFASYHPNLSAMTAIAAALDHQIGR